MAKDAQILQLESKLESPWQLHPNPLGHLPTPVRERIDYELKQIITSANVIPPTFVYELLYDKGDPDRLIVPYFEYRSGITPLKDVGFPGDIWIMISGVGDHRVYYRNDGFWDEWTGCESSWMACLKSTKVFKPRHPLLPTFFPWLTPRGEISWRQHSTLSSDRNRMMKYGCPIPTKGQLADAIPLKQAAPLPNACQAVGFFLRSQKTDKRKDTPRLDDGSKPTKRIKRSNRQDGGKSAASSSRFAANSRASRNTATGPRVSTLDSRPRRFRRQQRSQSASLPPFPRERRIRTPGASLKPAGAGPGPDDEVITISDDDSDDTYTVTSKVEDPRRRQRPSNDISNSQRRSSASTSSSAIDVSGAAPATDPIVQFIESVRLDQPTPVLLRYFTDEMIVSKERLDKYAALAQRSPECYSKQAFSQLKIDDRSSWVLILDAFQKRRLTASDV